MPFADEFQTIMHAIEGADDLCQHIWRRAHQGCGEAGSQDVFDIVATQQRRCGDIADTHRRTIRQPQPQAAVAGICPDIHLMLAAEKQHLPLRRCGRLTCRRIIRIEDGIIARLHELHHAPFRFHIALKGAIAVKVIGDDVGDGPHLRTAREPRQLHLADFQHHDIIRRERTNFVDQWHAHVAACQHAPPTLRREHFAQQGRGCGLARAASDANDRRGRPLEEQLRMIRDDRAPCCRLSNPRNADGETGGDARADENNICIGPCFRGIAARHQAHWHRQIRDARHDACQLFGAARICRGDAHCALVGGEACQGSAFHPHANQCDAFASQLGCVRCHALPPSSYCPCIVPHAPRQIFLPAFLVYDLLKRTPHDGTLGGRCIQRFGVAK